MTHIPPQQPTFEDMQFMLRMLQTDPESPSLDQILGVYGLGPAAIQTLRQDTALRGKTIDIIQQNIDRSILKWEDEWFRASWKEIEDGLINNDLNLYTRSVLTESPRLLQMVAQRLSIRGIVSLSQLINAYQSRYYTRNCLAYQTNLSFCLQGSIREHHGDITDMIFEKAEREGIRLDLAAAFAEAVKADDEETALRLRNMGAGQDAGLLAAVDNANVRMVKMILQSDILGTTLDKAFVAAASKHNIEIVEMLLNKGAHFSGKALVESIPNHKYIPLDADFTNFLLYQPGTAQLRPGISVQNLNDALARAAGNQNIDLMRQLIQLGASVNDIAITYAVESENADVIHLLLDNSGSGGVRQALYEADILARGKSTAIIKAWRPSPGNPAAAAAAPQAEPSGFFDNLRRRLGFGAP